MIKITNTMKIRRELVVTSNENHQILLLFNTVKIFQNSKNLNIIKFKNLVIMPT